MRVPAQVDKVRDRVRRAACRQRVTHRVTFTKVSLGNFKRGNQKVPTPMGASCKWLSRGLVGAWAQGKREEGGVKVTGRRFSVRFRDTCARTPRYTCIRAERRAAREISV